MKNNNTPAFPVMGNTGTNQDQILDCLYEGITIEQYFLAKAMQGILANPGWVEKLKVNDRGIDGNILSEMAHEAIVDILK